MKPESSVRRVQKAQRYVFKERLNGLEESPVPGARQQARDGVLVLVVLVPADLTGVED